MYNAYRRTEPPRMNTGGFKGRTVDKCKNPPEHEVASESQTDSLVAAIGEKCSQQERKIDSGEPKIFRGHHDGGKDQGSRKPPKYRVTCFHYPLIMLCR